MSIRAIKALSHCQQVNVDDDATSKAPQVIVAGSCRINIPVSR